MSIVKKIKDAPKGNEKRKIWVIERISKRTRECTIKEIDLGTRDNARFWADLYAKENGGYHYRVVKYVPESK